MRKTTLPDFVLNVDGMMCQKNCGSTVASAIQSVEGISAAEVVFSERIAKVWGPTQSLSAVIASIQDVGFDAALKYSKEMKVSTNSISQPHFVLNVDGMMCQKNCGSTVEGAIRTVKGVERVEVIFSQREARVWGMPEIIPNVIQSIEEVGFDANLKYSAPQSHSLGKQATNVNIESADVQLLIEGMVDPKICPSKVEDTLRKVDGVMSVSISFETKVASIWGFADVEVLIDFLERNSKYKAIRLSSIRIRTSNEGIAILNLDETLRCTNGSSLSAVTFNLNKLKSFVELDVDHQKKEIHLIYSLTISSPEKLVEDLISMKYTKKCIVSMNPKPTRILIESPKLNLVSDSDLSNQDLLLSIGGMSCANCATKVEKSLSKMSGVLQVTVSCMTNQAKVVINNELIGAQEVIEKIISLGYECSLIAEESESLKRDLLFSVSGMSCANCASKIERVLSELPGVLEASVSCMTNQVIYNIHSSLINLYCYLI